MSVVRAIRLNPIAVEVNTSGALVLNDRAEQDPIL